ncbi:protein eiger isoform X1 [Lucilia cuprina]|uniref:protein eiger isoform X1 n=1 Tax=Lucilia cuprina TaxID=7375 RepID=UPI001F06A904|nr:protein eiger isoform X1 [Lucilia cuprina]XP_046811035.1 protein eiger isoform X1 [Lucilia cuprina]XP_046811036.1 protein eiger isoform X1 [Lucilia cuprina]
MTAETLKPFITPTSAENYVTTDSSASASHHRRSCYFLAITASVITVILTAALLGITIWNTTRISNLQTEVQSLNRVIDNLHKRLGLTYLDDLNDFEKEEENNNALIDDVLPDADDDDDDNDHENMSGDDDEDEDDDDDDYEDYEELMNKFRHYQETEDDEEETDGVDSLGDDNLYDDFEKFNDSKNKHQGERKARSVSVYDNENFEENSSHQRQHILRSLKGSYPKSIVASENFERHRSPLRIHNHRKRKFPLLKNGDSLISAKHVTPTTANVLEFKPAAHFHINHTIPYHQHDVQITNQKGDVYIGKPSASNELNIEHFFKVENGVITVRQPGLYFVYAQICYRNNYPQNGFSIFHREKPFLQCLQNTFSNNVPLINTCHTSGLINLENDDQLHIRDFYSSRNTYLSPKSERSFFGLIKI